MSHGSRISEKKINAPTHESFKWNLDPFSQVASEHSFERADDDNYNNASGNDRIVWIGA